MLCDYADNFHRVFIRVLVFGMLSMIPALSKCRTTATNVGVELVECDLLAVKIYDAFTGDNYLRYVFVAGMHG